MKKLNYFFRKLAAAACLCLVAANFQAKDIYIAPSPLGDDANDGLTALTPVASMSRVFGLAPATGLGFTNGDVIHVDGFIDVTQDPYTIANPTSTNGFASVSNIVFTIDGGDKTASGFVGGNSVRFGDYFGGCVATFRNLTFKNLGKTGVGNGIIRILNNHTGGTTFDNCDFTGSQGTQGNINLYKNVLVVKKCNFYENTIVSGTAVYATGGEGADYILIDSCNVYNNNPSALSNASAAFFFQYNNPVTVKNVTVEDNQFATSGNGYGGFMQINTNPGTITVEDCIIQRNTIRSGGGFYITKDCGDITVKRCIMKANEVTGNGGGFCLFNAKTNVLIQDCKILDHVSPAAWGSAIDIQLNRNDSANAGTCKVVVQNAVIAGNQTTTGHCPGIRIFNDTNTARDLAVDLSIINSTITNNIVNGGNVGAIWIRSAPAGSKLNIINSTIAGNYNTNAGNGAGIKFASKGTGDEAIDATLNLDTKIYNSIIEQNSGAQNIISPSANYSDLVLDAVVTNLDIQNSYIGRENNNRFTNSPSYNNAIGYYANIATQGAGLADNFALNAILPLSAASAAYINTLGAIPLVPGAAGLTAGLASWLPAGVTTDQLGAARGAATVAVGSVETPSITTETTATVQQGSSCTVAASSLLNDADATTYPLSYALNNGTDNVPAGVSINAATGEISAGSTAAVGTYTLEIVVSDGIASITTAFVLDVATPTGVETAAAGKAIKAVSYSTVTGVAAPSSAKGVLLRKTVYADGSVKVEKVVK
ncbi:MAG: putative Ig domain-containing protein [Prevotella sp.]|jgi:hypothetical protein|nr:putative Ig domain-containing protein [Prevotella sp.]